MNSEIIMGIEFFRTNSDIYGNPRYIVHFPAFLTQQEVVDHSIIDGYNIALKRARGIGFRKYRGRDFGGGFVCKSYSLHHTAELIINTRENESKALTYAQV